MGTIRALEEKNTMKPFVSLEDLIYELNEAINNFKEDGDYTEDEIEFYEKFYFTLKSLEEEYYKRILLK